ncbi:Regulatory protein ADR1 [Lachnellula arida]|uniref:Regulatory protein ADR1 n=1 Tax=Lachnellula arida TaxID=1316785 RepID=A0A8T9B5A3_9HELO|nr:Regulatory protein ADR1 [Lachnellula arida]
MDVLCDAIDFTSPPAPPRPSERNETRTLSDTPHPQIRFSPQPQPQPQPGSGSGSSHSHHCHLCGRVYERADHLNRHLKSHENARPHKCDRCPKSFNRADLLNRHQAGHDHNAGIRTERTERVSTACLACIASKTKCQDEKPCARCQRRNIPCEMAPSKAHKSSHKARGSVSADILLSPKNASANRDEYSNSPRTEPTLLDDFDTRVYQSSEKAAADSMQDEMDHSTALTRVVRQPSPATAPMNVECTNGLFFDAAAQDFSFLSTDLGINNGPGFMVPDPYFSQDLDFSMWDIDLDSVELDYENMNHSLVSPGTPRPQKDESSNKPRDMAKRYAAFERSPWLWTPTPKDQALNDQNDLNLDEERIPSILSPPSPAANFDDFASCCINSKIRDQMLGLLFSLPRPPKKVVSFPSLSLLNTIIQIYFVQESYKIDCVIHPASVVPTRTIPQLYLAIIAQGSTLISTPSVWKMGLALQEVARNTVVELQWEQDNTLTRNLQTLQAFVICLDIGLWSGFKRKMELAESFGQPVISASYFIDNSSASRCPGVQAKGSTDASSRWCICRPTATITFHAREKRFRRRPGVEMEQMDRKRVV